MNQPHDVTFQADHQVLGASLYGLKASPLETLHHALWEGKAEVCSTQLDSVNASPQDVALKACPDGLYFGELRHEC